MTATNQRWMAWCGIVSMTILVLGQWVIAGFVPPPGPNKSMEEIVDIYVRDRDAIRIGIIIACAGVTLLGAWSVAMAIQMSRIEGKFAPLAWLQVLLGALLLVEFYIPSIIWEAVAFRPAFDPEWSYRMHDLASIMFIALPWTGMLQAIILGIAVLQDKREDPVFPRWVAYFSLWAALAFLPGGLNSLATEGPLAWNGVLAWWLGLVIFGTWIGVISLVLVKHAIPHQEREEAALAAQDGRDATSNAAPATVSAASREVR